MTHRTVLSHSFSLSLALALALAAPGCGSKADTVAPEAEGDSAVAGGPATAAAKPDSARADSSLLSRELLFGNPDKVAPRISPDGRQLLYIAPVAGVMNVWVGPTSDPGAAKPITDDKKRGIGFAGWSWGGDRVIYIQDEGGDENFHIYASDPATGERKDLTPLEGVQARFVGASPRFPDELLISLNERDREYHDIYRLNVKTGARELVLENTEGFAGFVTDDKFNLRLAIKPTKDGGQEHFIRKGEAWAPLHKIDREDGLATQIFGLNKKGDTLYMGDSRGRETAALVAYNLRTNKSKVLAEDPQVNLGGWVRDAKTYEPLAVAFNRERTRWELLSARIKPDFEYLKTVVDADFGVVDQNKDGAHWLVVYYRDDGPAEYYHYDRKAKQAKLLFRSREALAEAPLTKMHPVVIKARDGLELVSYLSLPPASDPDGDGRPDTPLPMVLFVHGGPWARVTWGYNPYHQWLTNRGYAVLDVNFRGSTGFTKAFANAGDHEWAGKMHDDLLDASRWAVDQGVAQQDKVAIMGGSYGGYAALVGLTFTPDAFACAVDIVGPSNLLTLLQTIPPYWAALKATFAQRVGDPDTEEGRALLLERSPLTRVDKIKRPLLIGQGANDPRVKQAESDQIVKAMQERSIPVTYVLYPDEGHGFARPENRKSFNAVTEAFLSECLGGSYLPVGDDLKGSSIAVPAGAELIPGLSAALAKGA